MYSLYLESKIPLTTFILNLLKNHELILNNEKFKLQNQNVFYKFYIFMVNNKLITM